ncbi:restriction endonuclease subunit S [Acetobacter cerevisiae]|uniref:Restriction endonuclease subunit S n=1 Tax=Acetobacter cerevisiae TaxID=178900 RepID=A0ABT1EV21_9PROT|nr:restriction endonuclease subunit S [Acetobacter cerevisiae]MCP1247217.1 restriction endonuclease subunit S [Acetobacter cerevisiae]MCP1256906.1 restriction endonuclease subunit S [Acetobacter cerevisiae]
MLPEGWKLSCLGDACSGALQTGPFGSQLHAHEYTEHGISVLMPKDLINYRANVETAAKISIEKSEELKRHHLKFGDILFSRRGDVARLALIDDNSKDSLCGTGCLRARPSTKNFAGFLFFFLQLPTIKSWLEHNAVGQTMPNMNTEILYELPLILPPLPEQKKIAAILSTWDRAIEGTEKLLANSQQQKKALMQQLLTGKKRLRGFTGEWKKKTLSNVCQIKTGKKDVNEGCENGEYPFFTCARQHTFSENYSYDCEAILIAGNGEVGKTHYYNGKFEAYQRTYILSDFTNISVFFILHFIEFFLPLDISKEKQHGAMPYIKLGTLKDFSVVTPPIPEQRAIATVLTTADEEIASLESDLSRLRQEKKALMQQLLTGKRRVTVD